MKICTLPRKASTWPAIPLMALRKISGRAARQGCWQGSMTFSLVIANWRNFWVCETTAGLHRFAGLPRQCRNRNQLCAMQSLLIPTGISCASSSAVSQSILTSVSTLHQLGNTGTIQSNKHGSSAQLMKSAFLVHRFLLLLSYYRKNLSQWISHLMFINLQFHSFNIQFQWFHINNLSVKSRLFTIFFSSVTQILCPPKKPKMVMSLYL